MIPHNGSRNITDGSLFLDCFSSDLLNYFEKNNIKLTYSRYYGRWEERKCEVTEITCGKEIHVDYGTDS